LSARIDGRNYLKKALSPPFLAKNKEKSGLFPSFFEQFKGFL